MWFFLIKSIAGSVIGNASNNWFRKTKLGIWTYTKIEQLMNWAAKRYHISVLTKEEKSIKKFPVLTERLDKIEAKLKELTNELDKR
jgi:hypothetical protein